MVNSGNDSRRDEWVVGFFKVTEKSRSLFACLIGLRGAERVGMKDLRPYLRGSVPGCFVTREVAPLRRHWTEWASVLLWKESIDF